MLKAKTNIPLTRKGNETMIKDRYFYPAILHYQKNHILLTFPDFPECTVRAKSEEEALQEGKEVLALHLYTCEQEGINIPEPTKVNQLKVGSGEVIILVEIWMPPFRHTLAQRAVKKTLTIPKWLNDLAEEKGVNFSQVLQLALKKHLGVTDISK